MWMSAELSTSWLACPGIMLQTKFVLAACIDGLILKLQGPRAIVCMLHACCCVA
jgi:hypothetical protein